MTTLTGTGALVRLALRRDRIRLPAWILGITALAGYSALELGTAYATTDGLAGVITFVQGPAGTMLTGPGYGFDHPTHAAVFAAIYGLYVLIGAALLNVLTVVRHTRVEEQSGRAELIRSTPTGRHSQAVAALIVAMIANLATATAVAAVLAAPYGWAGSLLFGCGVAAVGMVFAALASVAAQITEHSRGATGLAIAAMGAALIIRGAGDTLSSEGSALSWFSPFAWAQQTRPFVDGRWWPLGVCAALTVLAVAAALALQARRDVGAGLVPPRLGAASASRLLSTPMTLILRLERTALITWFGAVTVAAVLFGSLADAVAASAADLPPMVIEAMGGDSARLVDGFLATMIFINAILAACYAITAMHRLTTEESTGRTETVLATGTSRLRWMGSGVIAAAAGSALVLFGAGIGVGIGAAVTLGESGRLGESILAHLAYLPAVAAVIAVAALGYGLRAGAVNGAWAVVGIAMVLGSFGPLLDLPSVVMDLSPFEHVARMPSVPLAAAPLVALSAVSALVAALGLLGFRRRAVTG